MSHYYAHVLQMTKMIKQLDRWIEKGVAHATAKKFDPAVLLDARLAPDMYPLVKQVQSACDGAKFLAARLAGVSPPKHADNEKTVDEVHARIRSVLEFLGTLNETNFADTDARVIPLGFMPGKGLNAIDFLTEFNLPNTYFHLCMAYAILRHSGVDLGKSEFIGSLNLRDM
jgi:hypothetical protein